MPPHYSDPVHPSIPHPVNSLLKPAYFFNLILVVFSYPAFRTTMLVDPYRNPIPDPLPLQQISYLAVPQVPSVASHRQSQLDPKVQQNRLARCTIPGGCQQSTLLLVCCDESCVPRNRVGSCCCTGQTIVESESISRYGCGLFSGSPTAVWARRGESGGEF
jgi:hypothetical protein